MLNRKIEMNYNFNENDKLLTIFMTDTSENSVIKHAIEYDIDDFRNENRVNLYNRILVDLDAEYDDELANVIELITEKIINNVIEQI